MNFKFKTFSLLCAGLAIGLTACTNDDLLNGASNAEEYAGRYVHVTAGVQLPTMGGTRSSTDEEGETNSDATDNAGGKYDDDYEYGYDYENEIRTMILLYTDSEDNYITHSVITGITKAPVTNAKYDIVLTAEVKHDALYHAYMDENGVLANYNPKTDDIHVYAFCNYTDRLADFFENQVEQGSSNWIDWVGTIVQGSSSATNTPLIDNTIWAKRSFLMTNARVANVKFPETIGEWDNYADKNTPWQLNSDGSQDTNPIDNPTLSPVKVERSAARFDFRDGAPSPDYPNTYGLNVHPKSYADSNNPAADAGNTFDYEPSESNDPADGDKNLINIQLTRMALVNMSKDFYYLRRVSPTGNNQGVVYAGVETPAGGKTPYVVDTDWQAKQANYDVAGAAQAFNFPLFSDKVLNAEKGIYDYNKSGWYVDQIDKILGLNKYEGQNIVDTWSGSSGNRYSIWRYVTENTIPGAFNVNDDGDLVLDEETNQPVQTNPSTGVGANQQVQQSVGIVFKGSIKPGLDTDPETADGGTVDPAIYRYISKDAIDALKNVGSTKEKSPILYSFENRLFAGPEDIIAAAVQDGEYSALYGAVTRVLSNWKLYDVNGTPTFVYKDAASVKDKEALKDADGNVIELDVTIANEILNGGEGDNEEGYAISNAAGEGLEDALFRPLCPDQKIAVYVATDENDGEGWGYYCYYFYWNRHNDNLKSGLMGPMEFATVRNNVYKLSVTQIMQLGHPTIPTDDPDPVKPGDPDEPPTNYMRVQVDVLPWVVRVNNITF